MSVKFYPIFVRALLLAGAQVSPVCLSGKRCRRRNVKSVNGMIVTGETEILGEKHYTA